MPFINPNYAGAPDALHAEATMAVLNPAFYSRRYKPQALWTEAELAAYTVDPEIEPEGAKWA